MMNQKLTGLGFSLLAALTLASCQPTDTPTANSGAAGGRLKAVLDRGELKCGINGKLPGFSFIDTEGQYSGLDVDICRAIAAALFDDPNAVDYRPLSATERFTAVQTGEVDVLSRNTTWTTSRDSTDTQLAFAPVVFYDGQGMMVKTDSNIKTLKDLAGRSICAQSGTTTEKNLTDQMRKLKVAFTPVVFDDADTTYAAYAEGRCDGITSDRSQLLSRRTTLPQPDTHVILEEVMSKEPLAPAVADKDIQWFDAVKWIVYATVAAEELGINAQNLSQFSESDDPVIQRFLGKADGVGKGLGLPEDFAARVIKHVGNYGEIYNRNLGPETDLNLPRGQNQLWQDGGLLYAPPFR